MMCHSASSVQNDNPYAYPGHQPPKYQHLTYQQLSATCPDEEPYFKCGSSSGRPQPNS
jgi:hypothetical protein